MFIDTRNKQNEKRQLSAKQTCCNDIVVPVLAYTFVLTANLSTILVFAVVR